MPIVHVKYTCRTLVMTGKYDETIETDEKTVGGLVAELDRRYPGFKEIFIPKQYGLLNLKTMITVRRVGMAPFGVFDPHSEIKEFDKILFW